MSDTEATLESPDTDAEESEFEFVEDPTFDVNYLGECAYEVGVTIPPANERKQADEIFEELQSEAVVPGFRRGKAPRKLLENKFAKVVRGDVLEKLVGAAFRRLIKDKDLKPIEFPDIDGLEKDDERKDGEPLSFTFKFEVAPKCELGPYRGVEVERPVVTVDKEDVDEAIENMAQRFAVFEPAKKNTKAKEGDQVNIDFKGIVDGEPFEGGSAENYPYIVGSNRFFPEFEAALKGCKAGETLNCTVNFPDEYPSKEVAGKAAEFEITVHELKRKTLPALDDELAKQAGFDDMATMREKVAEELQAGSTDQSDRIARDRAIEKIVESSSFELPKSLVESSAQEYFNQELRRLRELRVPGREIEDRAEEIMEEARQNAIKNIKGYVVVQEIAEAEGVEVTDEDMEKEAEAIQKRTGMGMDVVAKFLAQDERINEYRDRIYRDKALAIVMDNAKVTDKEVAQDELEGEDEQTDS